jgi:hypothetical protein
MAISLNRGIKQKRNILRFLGGEGIPATPVGGCPGKFAMAISLNQGHFKNCVFFLFFYYEIEKKNKIFH